MKVNVLYPKRNFSAFDYNFSGLITERTYDESGDFVKFNFIEPNIDHYEVVSEVEFQDGTPNEYIFSHIVRSHNIGSYPEKISDKIRSGELSTQHSSFSSGDIIQIEGCFYISTGYTFELLPLEFSETVTV